MKSSSHRKRSCEIDVGKQPRKLAVRRRHKPPAEQEDKDSQGVSTNVVSENGKVQIPDLDRNTGQSTSSAKMKMLLFPLRESVRLGLEEDGYNPFLELTLSRKKKISSVIKHLITKWGRSRFAIGELVIFPFNSPTESTPSLRWTRDNLNITAEDVHVAVGSPPVFRLSYGWISDQQMPIAQVPRLYGPNGPCLTPNRSRNELTPSVERQPEQPDRLGILKEELQRTIDINKAAHPNADDQFRPDVTFRDMGNCINVDDGPQPTLVLWDDLTNLSIGGLLSEVSLQAKIKKAENRPVLELRQESLEAGSISGTALQLKNKNQNQFLEKNTGEQVNMGKGTLQSEFSWDDNLTNLSIGGLLSEVSLHRKVNSSLPEVRGSKVRRQEIVHLNSFNMVEPESSPQAPTLLLPESHTSIFDAEETCNAFAFKNSASRNASASSNAFAFKNTARKNVSTSDEVSSVSNTRDHFSTKPSKPPQTVDEKGKTMPAGDQLHKEIPLPLPGGLHDEESSLGLSGIKWNDTLGPFDLFLPNSRKINHGDGL